MWQYNHMPDSNELYHYGIEGQEWGKRRFQYSDGSLTPAGKLRYNDNNGYDNRDRDDYDEEEAAKKARGRKIALAVLGTAAAAITIAAIVKTSKSSPGESVADTGRDAVDDILSNKKNNKAAAKAAKAAKKVAAKNARIERYNAKTREMVKKDIARYKAGKGKYDAAKIAELAKIWGLPI